MALSLRVPCKIRGGTTIKDTPAFLLVSQPHETRPGLVTKPPLRNTSAEARIVVMKALRVSLVSKALQEFLSVF